MKSAAFWKASIYWQDPNMHAQAWVYTQALTCASVPNVCSIAPNRHPMAQAPTAVRLQRMSLTYEWQPNVGKQASSVLGGADTCTCTHKHGCTPKPVLMSLCLSLQANVCICQQHIKAMRHADTLHMSQSLGCAKVCCHAREPSLQGPAATVLKFSLKHSLSRATAHPSGTN